MRMCRSLQAEAQETAVVVAVEELRQGIVMEKAEGNAGTSGNAPNGPNAAMESKQGIAKKLLLFRFTQILNATIRKTGKRAGNAKRKRQKGQKQKKSRRGKQYLKKSRLNRSQTKS